MSNEYDPSLYQNQNQNFNPDLYTENSTLFSEHEFYNPSPLPPYHTTGGLNMDTATIVSVVSSCIILISGCIAVVCLIMYMKKTEVIYRSRTCTKCGANIGSRGCQNEDDPHQTPRNRQLCNPTLPQTPMAPLIEPAQLAILNQQLANAGQPRQAIYGQTIGQGIGATLIEIQQDTPAQPQQTQQQQTLKKAEYLKTAFLDAQDDSYFEDSEPTPYATFSLPGFGETKNGSREPLYESFKIFNTESPLYTMKKSPRPLDCPPQYADSVDYKSPDNGNDSSVTIGNPKEEIYHSAAGANSSVASSNHEELMRAYEYGRKRQQSLGKLQDELFECLAEDEDETCYRSLPSDEHDSPTDPGICKFTKSPPAPNEQRTGVVVHHRINNAFDDNFDLINSENVGDTVERTIITSHYDFPKISQNTEQQLKHSHKSQQQLQNNHPHSSLQHQQQHKQQQQQPIITKRSNDSSPADTFTHSLSSVHVSSAGAASSTNTSSTSDENDSTSQSPDSTPPGSASARSSSTATPTRSFLIEQSTGFGARSWTATHHNVVRHSQHQPSVMIKGNDEASNVIPLEDEDEEDDGDDDDDDADDDDYEDDEEDDDEEDELNEDDNGCDQSDSSPPPPPAPPMSQGDELFRLRHDTVHRQLQQQHPQQQQIIPNSGSKTVNLKQITSEIEF